MSKKRSEVSEIGYWSEIKLEIIRDYASAYSRIMAAQTRARLKYLYIDAFSGAGFHVSKTSGELVWGSPMSVLLVDPPFSEYHFIDLEHAVHHSEECRPADRGKPARYGHREESRC